MGYPFSGTYTVSAGDSILADHYNSGINDIINNNIPENIDDYSVSVAEMQAMKDPYVASTEVQAVNLAEELQEIRYQLLELKKVINPTHTDWYDDVGKIRAVLLRFEPGATPATNINISSIANRGNNIPAITNATDLAVGGTSGSFSVDNPMTVITMDIGPNVTGILGVSIETSDLNNSSALAADLYHIFVDINSNNLRISFRIKGSQASVDPLTILAASDRCDVLIAFVTAT